MGVLNYTTTISVEKTAGEMQGMLGRSGAAAVTLRFADARLVGLSFALAGPHGMRAFLLPVDVGAMQKLLDRQWADSKIQRRYATPEQAERVAWRVVKDWLAAQLALVQAQMASLDQVMLPYLVMDDAGTTLYDAYRKHDLRALTTGD